MGIRFYCPDCGRKLNIKTFLAGKRGICPYCDARLRIPVESQLPEGAPKYRPIAAGNLSKASAALATQTDDDEQTVRESLPDASDPLAEAPEAVWYVRAPSGGEYGPAPADLMRRWLTEGRVGPDSMVWREGWTDWRAAGPLFASLTAPASFREVTARPSLANAPAPSTAVPEWQPSGASAAFIEARRAAARRKSVVPLVILGLLILVLLAVAVVVLTR